MDFDNSLRKKNSNLMNSTKIAFVTILIYISYFNFLVLKTTPEIIFLQFLVITLLFKQLKTKRFVKDWVPFIAVFLLYEFLRGHADNISPFRNHVIYWVFTAEQRIFPQIPTKYLQNLFGKDRYVINISFIFYSSFFYYSFLVGFLIWLKSKYMFLEYSKKFIILSFIGLFFYFLIPTAPPWLVAEKGLIDIKRLIYNDPTLLSFHGISLYKYFVQGNTIAAFPSLHVAWPTFTSLFLIKTYYKKWYSYLSLIIPLMIGFSVVLTGEHFFLDIVFGMFLATITLFTPGKSLLLNIKKKAF